MKHNEGMSHDVEGASIETSKKPDASLTFNQDSSLENLQRPRYLTPEEYREDFANKEMSQGSIGNCYLVSAIWSLMQWDAWEQLIMTSVKKSYDQYGREVYHIQIPLGEPGANIYDVHINELTEDLKVHDDYFDSIADFRGGYGIKALIYAYIKHVTGKDRVDPGFSESGRSYIAVYNLMGLENLSSQDRLTLYQDDVDFEESMIALFLSFDACRDSVFLSVCSHGKIGEYFPIVKNGEGKFNSNHAVALRAVDVQKRLVTLADPHDTSQVVVMSRGEVLEYVSVISKLQSSKNLIDRHTMDINKEPVWARKDTIPKTISGKVTLDIENSGPTNKKLREARGKVKVEDGYAQLNGDFSTERVMSYGGIATYIAKVGDNYSLDHRYKDEKFSYSAHTSLDKCRRLANLVNRLLHDYIKPQNGVVEGDQGPFMVSRNGLYFRDNRNMTGRYWINGGSYVDVIRNLSDSFKLESESDHRAFADYLNDLYKAYTR